MILMDFLLLWSHVKKTAVLKVVFVVLRDLASMMLVQKNALSLGDNIITSSIMDQTRQAIRRLIQPP